MPPPKVNLTSFPSIYQFYILSASFAYGCDWRYNLAKLGQICQLYSEW